jgi:hypothetical protein
MGVDQIGMDTTDADQGGTKKASRLLYDPAVFFGGAWSFDRSVDKRLHFL